MKTLDIANGGFPLIVVLVSLMFFVGCGEKASDVPETASASSAAIKDMAKARRPPAKTRKQEKSGPRIECQPKPLLAIADENDDDDDEKRPPEVKALAKEIEKALDDEVLADALKCVPRALRCPDREIRQAMVDTLGWFGKAALPELTPFLADPDEDVRENAQSEWSMAIADIENDAEKIGTVELAMNILDDEDFLDDISGEYIGIDEKLAVESLMRIIAANGSANGVAKAKETYEFVTGDEWKDEAEARRWIREEYEPDEN